MPTFLFRNTADGTLIMAAGNLPFDASNAVGPGSWQIAALSDWAPQTLEIPEIIVPRHVFLVAGQSNATSRAAFDDGVDWPVEALQWGRNGADDGEVIAASRPLQHHSAPQAGGMGWALQFTLDYLAANPGIEVLLVPAARGGTGFSNGRWNPGDDLYADAVARTNAALVANPGALLAGILWHQGESDADSAAEADAYEAALDAMIAAMRGDITGATTVPFVLGGMASSWVADDPLRQHVQAVVEATPGRAAHTAYADSAGLGTSDGVHFDAASFRALGSRYHDALAVAAANVPAAPDQVTGMAVVPGDRQNVLTWAAPAANGATIIDYAIEVDAGSGFAVLADGAGAGTAFTHAGLTNGTTYTYRVAAVNALGQGAFSAPASGMPAAGSTAEAGALGHWLLGSDGTTLAGGSLGTIGTPPTLRAGYAAWSGTRLRGYNTGIADGTTRTICAVVRIVRGNGNCIFGGNNDLSTGRIMFYADGVTTFRLRTDPGGNLYDIDTAFPNNEWCFVSVSMSGASYLGYRGRSGAAVTKSGALTSGTPKGAIGIGNIGLDNAAVAAPLDVAEFIVFDKALTLADLQAVHMRSRDRLATRGILLPAP